MHSAAFHRGQTVSVEIQGSDPQTVRANKLELVERFADDLAHEIKNPLHSMVINLEVLKRRISREGGSPPEELLRYAGVLASELERVNRRIELLLRLVRPDRGTELVSITDAVEELLELFELERDRRRIEIHFSPAPVPVRGHISHDAARQIVLNLLLDALDAVAPGGDLDIRTVVEPDWVHLRLLGPLAPATTEHGAESAAPHLPVARALAEAFHGRVELHVEADASFTLTLSLPLSPP
jgi:signal transduction histidine kinase